MAAANRAGALAMLPNLGGLSLREAAPCAAAFEEDVMATGIETKTYPVKAAKQCPEFKVVEMDVVYEIHDVERLTTGIDDRVFFIKPSTLFFADWKSPCTYTTGYWNSDGELEGSIWFKDRGFADPETPNGVRITVTGNLDSDRLNDDLQCWTIVENKEKDLVPLTPAFKTLLKCVFSKVHELVRPRAATGAANAAKQAAKREAKAEKAAAKAEKKAAAKPAKKRWLKFAAPAGALDVDLASATSDEDQAPCPSRCHKEKEDDESYKCYKPCGDDEPEPLVTAPDEPLLELAPPAASATPMLSGTTTGAPVSLTRFADRPVTTSGDDAVSPDVVIGWFAEAARSMQPVILAALEKAQDLAPDEAPVAQRELEQLQEEAQAARDAAQRTLDENWEGKTVALPRPGGESMVEVRLLAAGRALVEMQAAVHNKTRWAPPQDGVTRMKEWLPLATVDDARGGFYTDANEMDVDRLKLDRWRKQFEDAFPYLISPAMQEVGVAEADPAYWAAKLERLQSEYTREQLDDLLDDFKEAHYIEFPHAAPLTPKQRADMKAICVEAVLEIQSIIDKHDYNHQRYEAMRAEGKETFGVRRNGKDRVELALKTEHTQTYYRIRQATDKAVREGRARKGERDTVSKAGTFAELVRTITAPGRVVPQHWPLAAVNGIVAWAKDKWLRARIAERNRFTESKDKARAALDAAAKPYHDAVSTRDRALDQLAALAADEEKMNVAFGHAMLMLAPLDKQDFATLASLFHAFRPHHDARTDGVRMLDESGAPPAAAHPPTNRDLLRFLASNAFDLIAVPDKGNVLVHRVAGPRWMRDLRLQRVLHALLAEWQVTPTYELNRTADYDNSVHAVLKARRDSPAALTACRAAALAIEAGARYALSLIHI